MEKLPDVMGRRATLTIMASLMVVILVLWIIFRTPNCRADGALLLQVGEVRYLVPAWMKPYPNVVRELQGLEKSSVSQQNNGFSSWCQSTSTPVLKVPGFSFSARAASARSDYPHSTASIVPVSRLAAPIRPSGEPLPWRDIRSATFGRRIVSTDRKRASIFFSLRLASGRSRRFEARCLYGVYDNAELKDKEYLQRCSTFVALERGNALELIVNPGDDPAAIGRELIQSLRAVEIMARRNERARST